MTVNTFYCIFKTRVGWMGLLGSAAGMRRVILPQSSDVKVAALLGEAVREAGPSTTAFNNLPERLQAYFDGNKVEFPDMLDLPDATPFQRQVWEAARKIPYGKTHTYTWLAEQAGKPRAVRATGQALSLNPCPIVVPCHRVTYTGGGIGGFTGGIAIKKYLLELEKNRHVVKSKIPETA